MSLVTMTTSSMESFTGNLSLRYGFYQRIMLTSGFAYVCVCVWDAYQMRECAKWFSFHSWLKENLNFSFTQIIRRHHFGTPLWSRSLPLSKGVSIFFSSFYRICSVIAFDINVFLFKKKISRVVLLLLRRYYFPFILFCQFRITFSAIESDFLFCFLISSSL